MRGRILERALKAAGEREIPESGPRLEVFVRDHLSSATAMHLGDEMAEAVAASISPLVLLAQQTASRPPHRVSGEREATVRVGRERQHSGVAHKGISAADGEADLDTTKYPRVQPLGDALPMVFVATSSLERCEGIANELQECAVQRIEDVVSFLDHLKATSSLSPLIVIDCLEASIRPATIATLAHELPRRSGVLLWGATDEHQQLVDVATRNRGWLRCDGTSTPGEVAGLIRMLLGE